MRTTFRALPVGPAYELCGFWSVKRKHFRLGSAERQFEESEALVHTSHSTGVNRGRVGSASLRPLRLFRSNSPSPTDICAHQPPPNNADFFSRAAQIPATPSVDRCSNSQPNQCAEVCSAPARPRLSRLTQSWPPAQSRNEMGSGSDLPSRVASLFIEIHRVFLTLENKAYELFSSCR
jgi:hypothetical protein